MYNRNLTIKAVGNLVKDWHLAKTCYVTTLAVHNGNQTTFIDLISQQPFESKKGDLLSVSGSVKVSVWNNKPSISIFVDEVTNLYEKAKKE